MSAAGDRLRLERERFERELRLSETTRDAAVGADDSAHFLADSPRTDDDAVWDLDVGDSVCVTAQMLLDEVRALAKRGGGRDPAPSYPNIAIGRRASIVTTSSYADKALAAS